jgi:uncharacterized membrane protein
MTHRLPLVLTPFVVATVVGLIALWPDEASPRDPVSVGAPDDLIDAEVIDLRRGVCAETPPEAGLQCTRPVVRPLEGPDEGERVELLEQPEGPGSPRLEEGETVVLSYEADAEVTFRYTFSDRERRTPLYILAALFAVAVVALGRWQGLRALLALAFTLAVLIIFVLPAMLEGASPLLVALVGASTIALVGLYVAHGPGTRTTVAVIGTLTSLALVGVLGAVFVAAARFSGLASEEASYLQIAAGQVDLEGLLLGGVVIGALGVLDDVTVTQVSAVWELRKANPEYAFDRLYRAGLQVGRDHITSTVNTLVLAYAGASLPLFLLFTETDQHLVDVLNGEVVAVEVVRTLVGSLGLVASVPITTALAALAARRGRAATEPTPSPGRRRRSYRSRQEERFWRGTGVS